MIEISWHKDGLTIVRWSSPKLRGKHGSSWTWTFDSENNWNPWDLMQWCGENGILMSLQQARQIRAEFAERKKTWELFQ